MKRQQVLAVNLEDFQARVREIAREKNLRPVFAAGVGYMLQDKKGYTAILLTWRKP